MKNKFQHRSHQSELIDSEAIPHNLFYKNLRELDFLNRYTGGHAISIEGLKKLIVPGKNEYKIADLGCGSGDTLKYFAKWAQKRDIKMKFTGVDKNPAAINYLKSHCSGYPEITGIQADFTDFLKNTAPYDIIHCSLFCHHLNDEEFTALLKQLKTSASVGFIINDLQRSSMAYYSAKIFTILLNGSRLSKNDGPVSVLRAFRLHELHHYMKEAGIDNYRIYRRIGFRFLIVGKCGFQSKKP